MHAGWGGNAVLAELRRWRAGWAASRWSSLLCDSSLCRQFLLATIIDELKLLTGLRFYTLQLFLNILLASTS